jgi:hypothetical protein
MPRYYFNVADGHDIVDTDGTELADAREARAQAIITAGEILRDEGTNYWHGTEWTMRVTDDQDDPVFTLRFSADDHTRGSRG